jgi:hypothetical protein
MKIIKTIALTSFIVFSIFLLSSDVAEATTIKFKPSTTIPGSEFVSNVEMDINSNSLGKLIVAIYNYGIGLVSVLAVVMIMLGGFKWIFAAGNATKISGAKSTIVSALVGLFLALGSWMLLYTINPALTTFKSIVALKPVIGTCPIAVTNCANFNSFFDYVKNEAVADGDSAVDNALAYYKKNLLMADNSSANAVQNKMCGDYNVQESCGIYPGLCFNDSDSDSTSDCKSITALPCPSPPEVCPSGSLCQTNTNYCSLGARGSICNYGVSDGDGLDECNGLDCVDGRCFRLGLEGEACAKNGECAANLACSNSRKMSFDMCISGIVTCEVKEDCENQGNYGAVGATNIGLNCANANYCDCNFDSDCKPGTKCINIHSDGAYRDICYPVQ